MNDLLDSDTPLLTFPSGHCSHLLTKLINNGKRKTNLTPSLILPIILGKVVLFFYFSPLLPYVPAEAQDQEEFSGTKTMSLLNHGSAFKTDISCIFFSYQEMLCSTRLLPSMVCACFLFYLYLLAFITNTSVSFLKEIQ